MFDHKLVLATALFLVICSFGASGKPMEDDGPSSHGYNYLSNWGQVENLSNSEPHQHGSISGLSGNFNDNPAPFHGTLEENEQIHGTSSSGHDGNSNEQFESDWFPPEQFGSSADKIVIAASVLSSFSPKPRSLITKFYDKNRFISI